MTPLPFRDFEDDGFPVYVAVERRFDKRDLLMIRSPELQSFADDLNREMQFTLCCVLGLRTPSFGDGGGI